MGSTYHRLRTAPIDAAEGKARHARYALERVEDDADDVKQARVKEATASLYAEIARIAARIHDEVDAEVRENVERLTRERAEAEAAHLALRVEAAAMHPLVGKTVQTRYGPTRTRAVIEVFKDGDPLPANLRYSRPSPGDLVARRLNSKGERMTSFVGVFDWSGKLTIDWEVVS